MTDLLDSVEQQMQPWQRASGWCVAFSGGLDSMVLLHVLSRLRERQSCPPLRALHIHHGLQQQALQWPEHCSVFCERLAVPFKAVSVQVAEVASVEQAARDARYAAFREALRPGEVLLLAQHLDDQAETLMLRLLRGAGVTGLQGMPEQRPLGDGQLLRPLLGVPKKQLEEYAQLHELDWIDDPSNDSDVYDRNFLRNQVMPQLSERWPGLTQVLQRTAGHMRQAQELLDELAQLDIQQAADTPWPDWLPLDCLNLGYLRQLSAQRQTNALRYWLAGRTLLPDTAHWAGWQALLQAGPSATPRWCLQAGELQRHGQQLYWLPDSWQQALPPLQLELKQSGCHQLPGNGRLCVDGLPPGNWWLGYRQGGEVMQLPGRGRRDLKRLLQEQRLPIFVRNRIPLLYEGEHLVAVAGLAGLCLPGAPMMRWYPPD